MFDRKTLKTRAKAVLARSYLTTLLACLIFSFVGGGLLTYNLPKQNLNLTGMSDFRIIAVFSAVGLILLAALAFSVFVVSPLSVGLKIFLLRSADGDTNIENMLYPFKNNYKNIVAVQLVKNLYIFLWSLLGYIPLVVGLWKFGLYETLSVLVNTFSATRSIDSALALMMIGSGMLILTIIFSMPAYIKTLQYSMTEYILAENSNLSPNRAIGRSKEIMAGNKWAYVKLMFSFIGWHLLANLTCCIGAILLEPYIQATYTQMYLEISGQGKDYDIPFGTQNPFGGPFGGF